MIILEKLIKRYGDDTEAIERRLRDVLDIGHDMAMQIMESHGIQEAEWDESKHPRDEQGRFGSGGGTGQPSLDVPERIATNTKKEEYAAKYQEFAAFDESPVGMLPEPIHDTPEPSPEHIATAYFVLMKYPDMNERDMIENAWQADKIRARHEKNLPAKVNMLKQAMPQFVVAGRVKTRKSMLDKLGRKRNYTNVGQLKDSSGMRVITTNLIEVEYAKQFVRENFKIVDDGDEDYITNPNAGYRSHHFESQDHDGLISEMQVRTENEDKWANFFHDSIYKDKEGLKPEEKKRFDAALPQIIMYGAQMSEYYYQVDQGYQAIIPDCPPEIQQLVGCL